MTHKARFQEIYDITLNHLRKQGHAAVARNGTCAYRMANGDKCAAGVHIPDDKYSPAMEGAEVSLVSEMTGVDWGFNRDDLTLLSSLQSSHDYTLRLKGMGEWELEMAETARAFDLAYTPVSKLDIATGVVVS